MHQHLYARTCTRTNLNTLAHARCHTQTAAIDIYGHTHRCTQTYRDVHTQAHTHRNAHPHKHAHLHKHTLTHIRTYTYVHTYTHTHACTHICTYTYTNTHAHNVKKQPCADIATLIRTRAGDTHTTHLHKNIISQTRPHVHTRAQTHT